MKFKELPKEHEEFIRDNYLKLPIKVIARKLETNDGLIKRRLKKWGLVIPIEVIKKNKEYTVCIVQTKTKARKRLLRQRPRSKHHHANNTHHYSNNKII